MSINVSKDKLKEFLREIHNLSANKPHLRRYLPGSFWAVTDSFLRQSQRRSHSGSILGQLT